ncbi:CLUMA_CG017832, isoform A [Clunio marinus]|uniref:CLUMA_CG017832, isoform A n=1 Tax=Clunio marinus TaxID=568069 RepID=A0A1J1IYZ5_9DIPT|nr:CLUMA_CG017832, isoform A [Clunio marinus]
MGKYFTLIKVRKFHDHDSSSQNTKTFYAHSMLPSHKVKINFIKRRNIEKRKRLRIGSDGKFHDLTQSKVLTICLFLSALAFNMTSPSMKSAEKKTPEKKRTTSESSEHSPTENAEQDTRRLRLDLNAFAWMRIFTFANLLVRQG